MLFLTWSQGEDLLPQLYQSFRHWEETCCLIAQIYYIIPFSIVWGGYPILIYISLHTFFFFLIKYLHRRFPLDKKTSKDPWAFGIVCFGLLAALFCFVGAGVPYHEYWDGLPEEKAFYTEASALTAVCTAVSTGFKILIATNLYLFWKTFQQFFTPLHRDRIIPQNPL